MKTLIIFVLSTFLSSALGFCNFNGTAYNGGDTIPSICFNITCRFDGENLMWEASNNYANYKKCAKCRVSNDPHFETFDNYHHHWHGTCNYTISQSLDTDLAWGYNARYGIYGDFTKCSALSNLSCLDVTTYKADLFTAIKIIHSEVPLCKLHINGNSENISSISGDIHPYPSIIAWCTEECIYLQGPDFSMHICENWMNIWTTPAHLTHKLAGLCGLYSSAYDPDEHTGRDGTEHQLDLEPVLFPLSWQTNEQSSTSPCSIPPTPNCPTNAENTKLCTHALADSGLDTAELNNLMDNCLQDLCRDPDNKNQWLGVVAGVARTEGAFSGSNTEG